jgi:ComF family protein
MNKLFNSFLDLLFPNTCAACTQPLLQNEPHICSNCMLSLPKANLGFATGLQPSQRFHNIPCLHQVLGYYKFTRGGGVQRILHEIKYRNNPDLGLALGRYFGQNIKDSIQPKPDLLVPVPLFAGKLAQRGYNQSQMIAAGIGEVLNIPVAEALLTRKKATQTQTRKARIERFYNVEGVFELADQAAVAGKHIAIVDDVLTTGATLEVCAEPLLAAKVAQISILALAIAE